MATTNLPICDDDPSAPDLKCTVPVDDDAIAAWDAGVGPAVARAIVRCLNALPVVVPGYRYDSLDREALFCRAVDRFGITYNDLYDAWLEGA